MPSEKNNQQVIAAQSSGSGRLVAYEVGRALGAGLLLPWRALGQFMQRARLKSAFTEDLKSEATFAPDERALVLPQRPLRIFISCAEASGETHARNWVRSLRAALEAHGAPAPALVGLGGAGLAEEGVRILGDPVSEARMGFAGVLEALPFYVRLLRSAAQEFIDGELDLFVGVDSPALHVPLGHMARRMGIPAAQYIAPQYWGWAPWRVASFRQAFDRALTILPFEPAWYARHGVVVEHVGHPQLDDLPAFHGKYERDSEGQLNLVLLPGSRRSVIARNLPCMLASIEEFVAPRGSWRVRVLQNGLAHRELIQDLIASSPLPPGSVEISTELEAELSGAQAALSVSGTILTHLLHARLPTVVLYRLESGFQKWLGEHFLTVPHFSSVNLLAGVAVYPEFSFAGEEIPADYRAAVERLLRDEAWRQECSRSLEEASRRLGPAGASHRAALACLALYSEKTAPQAP